MASTQRLVTSARRGDGFRPVAEGARLLLALLLSTHAGGRSMAALACKCPVQLLKDAKAELVGSVLHGLHRLSVRGRLLPSYMQAVLSFLLPGSRGMFVRWAPPVGCFYSPCRWHTAHAPLTTGTALGTLRQPP